MRIKKAAAPIWEHHDGHKAVCLMVDGLHEMGAILPVPQEFNLFEPLSNSRGASPKNTSTVVNQLAEVNPLGAGRNRDIQGGNEQNIQ